jgi:hypothetical protein
MSSNNNKSNNNGSSINESTLSELNNLGFSREELLLQKKKRNEWINSIDKEADERRKQTLIQTQNASNKVLKVILFIWILLIVCIFGYIYSTIMYKPSNKFASKHFTNTSPNPAHEL